MAQVYEVGILVWHEDEAVLRARVDWGFLIQGFRRVYGLGREEAISALAGMASEAGDEGCVPWIG